MGELIRIRPGERSIGEKDIDPEKLLPILKRYRSGSPGKYEELVEIICRLTETEPEELI